VKDKKAFTRRIGDFLAGKGFYVVLFICTAVIGVSAWILLSTGSNFGTTETGGIASGSPDNQEVMLPSDFEAADVSIADVLEQSPVVSPAPSDAGNASAAPTDNKPENKSENKPASEGEGTSAPVMAKELTFVWPVSGEITAAYSVDELIYNKTMSDWRTHNGIDIKSLLGTKVVAVADGTVSDVYNDDLLGTTVVIDHGSGMKSIYANLAKTPVVKTGDKVAMGAVIGAVGDTAIGETCEVSHLHFAMTKDDEPADPIKYLPKN
jgi:murein DD-endopeptidase MepM/ murein hydrolase activator NlpD